MVSPKAEGMEENLFLVSTEIFDPDEPRRCQIIDRVQSRTHGEMVIVRLDPAIRSHRTMKWISECALSSGMRERACTQQADRRMCMC